MIDIEFGKVIARLDAVQKDVSEMKKQIDFLHQQVVSLPNILEKENEKRFITRIEIMPIKNALSMITLTTISAICMGLVQLLFNLF